MRHLVRDLGGRVEPAWHDELSVRDVLLDHSCGFLSVVVSDQGAASTERDTDARQVHC